MKDLEWDFQDLEARASDRVTWAHRVRQLEQSMKREAPLTMVGDAKWEERHKSLVCYREAQFVEEAEFPELRFPGFLHAYTDGSALCVDGCMHSGWGVVYTGHHSSCMPHGEERGFLCDDVANTNNRAELFAVVEVLNSVPPSVPLCIHTDSMVVWEYVHLLRERFKITLYERFSHLGDLYRCIHNLLNARTAETYVIKVRAHMGNPFNEQADELAKSAALGCVSTRARAGVQPVQAQD
jgi:ribonuclease HI